MPLLTETTEALEVPPPPVVPWAAFDARNAREVKQGDHQLFVGPTQSGKTVLCRVRRATGLHRLGNQEARPCLDAYVDEGYVRSTLAARLDAGQVHHRQAHVAAGQADDNKKLKRKALQGGARRAWQAPVHPLARHPACRIPTQEPRTLRPHAPDRLRPGWLVDRHRRDAVGHAPHRLSTSMHRSRRSRSVRPPTT